MIEVISYHLAKAIMQIRKPFEPALVMAPAWSSLQALGQSPVMKLTILMPAVGWLIIFNAAVINALAVSPIATFGIVEPSAPSWRLVAMFFGLLALGIGSFFFSVASPADLKSAPTLHEFTAREQPILTPARASTIAIGVVDNFHKNRVHDHEERAFIDPWLPAYPREQEARFNRFAEVTGQAVFAQEAANYGEDQIGVFDRRGDVNPTVFAQQMQWRVGAARNLPIMLGDEAVKIPMDLLALRYGDLNHSRPMARLIVTSCYWVGFGLLSLPTIATVVSVVATLFRAWFK